MILGITGGSGCGKTTALEAVRDLGGLVLDCDAIYHDLLSRSPSLLAPLTAAFPAWYLNPAWTGRNWVGWCSRMRRPCKT